MRVVIVGGGIAGLTAAAALSRDAHDVVVLERARDLTPVGAGLGVWPNAARALEWLGLARELDGIGAPFASTEIRDMHGRTLNKLDPTKVLSKLGGQPLMVHRADLQAMLVRAAREADVRLSATATSATTKGSTVQVELSDGTDVHGDLVIAADGARSSIRRAFDSSEPRQASPLAWRAVVRTDIEVSDAWLSIGNGHQFLATPLADGRVYIAGLVHLPASQEPPNARGLRELHRGWHPPVPQLLAALDDQQLRWDPVLHRKPPRRLHSGRVVLIGDAAHPMTPDLGQGGCQAIEDAVLLAALFRRDDDIDAVLDRFTALRRARIRRVVNDSRRIGASLALSNPLLARARDALMRVMPANAALAQLTRNASVRSLEQQLASTGPSQPAWT